VGIKPIELDPEISAANNNGDGELNTVIANIYGADSLTEAPPLPPKRVKTGVIENSAQKLAIEKAAAQNGKMSPDMRPTSQPNKVYSFSPLPTV
jgi:hypothetical protein